MEERPGKRTLVISDLETLKAISDPLRVRILDALDEPRSVTETAAVLGLPRSRLYYHFKILEQHELIQAVDSRVVSGIVERRYEAAADSYEIAPALTPTVLATSGAVASVFDEARAGFEAALRGSKSNSGERGLLHRVDLRLTAARRKELVRKLEDLVDEFQSDPPDDDAQPYGLLLSLYNRTTPNEEGDDA